MNSKEHSYLVNNAKKNAKLTVEGAKFLAAELNAAIQKADMTKLKSTKEGYIGGSSLRILQHLDILDINETKEFREALGNTTSSMLQNPEKYGLNEMLRKLKRVEIHRDHALGSRDETENRKRPAIFFGYPIEEHKDDHQMTLSGLNPKFIESKQGPYIEDIDKIRF